VSERGDPLNYHVTARTFVALVRRLGMRGPAGSRGSARAPPYVRRQPPVRVVSAGARCPDPL